MGTLFWVVVGAFLGWNLPQPAYAKRIQLYLVDAWNKFITQE